MIVLYSELTGWEWKCSKVTSGIPVVKVGGRSLKQWRIRLIKLLGLVKNLFTRSQKFKGISLCGVPLELILGLILFEISINNLDSGKEHSESTEETTFGEYLVNCHSEGQLEKWADRNFTNFNQDKFRVLCLGWDNPMLQCREEADWLGSYSVWKNLVVLERVAIEHFFFFQCRLTTYWSVLERT